MPIKPHSANQSILPVAVASCLVALGLTLVPTTMTDSIRAAVHDATLPGHHLLAFARLQIYAAKDSLTSSDDSQQRIAALESQLRNSQQRYRRVKIETGLLQEQLILASQNGVSPYRPTPSDPLIVPELLQANVLGEETGRLWRGGALIERGTSDGIRESTLVLEDNRTLVDQGADKGLAAGQPVYSGRNVVGKIAIVGRWTSTVCPVTDPKFRGMAQLARSSENRLLFGPQAILEGCGERLCRLKLIPATEPVSVGDEVYTSQRDAALPYPLYYGKVVSAEIQPGALHWEIRVEPAVKRIDAPTVQILTRKLNPLRQISN